MAVLRELVSRFSFDVDKKSVKEYDKTIGNMKGSVKKLAGAFGVALSAGAIFQAGKTALGAEVNLKRVAGVKFDKLQDELVGLRERLNAIREGTGEILTDREYNTLATGFIESFGKSNKEIDKFLTLLQAATIQARVTGKSVGEIFTGFMAGVATGDLQALVGVGGLDLGQVQVAEDLLARIDPGTIGKREIKQLRAAKILDLLSKAQSEQTRQLEASSQEFLDIQESTKRLGNTFDSVSEKATVAGVKITNELVDTAIGSYKLYSGLFSDLARSTENLFTDEGEVNGKKALKPIAKTAEKIIVKPSVVIHNNFSGTPNEKLIAAEMDKRLKQEYSDATNQIIRSEKE